MRVDFDFAGMKISNLTQRKIAVIGGTGSGKTTTLKLFALNSPVPVYVFDFIDVVDKIGDFKKVVIRKKNIAGATGAGAAFNRLTGGKVIFSFKGLLQREIVEWCESFFSVWRPKNALILMDEVHEVVPEGSGIYSEEIERAVRHWRNNNVGFGYSSQRPALVSKNVLALSDYLILYRTTWSHDLEAVKAVLANGMNKTQVDTILRNIQTKPFLNGISVDFQPKTV